MRARRLRAPRRRRTRLRGCARRVGGGRCVGSRDRVRVPRRQGRRRAGRPRRARGASRGGGACGRRAAGRRNGTRSACPTGRSRSIGCTPRWSPWSAVGGPTWWSPRSDGGHRGLLARQPSRPSRGRLGGARQSARRPRIPTTTLATILRFQAAELWLCASSSPDRWVDIEVSLDAKVAALRCHATQLGGGSELGAADPFLRELVVEDAPRPRAGPEACGSVRRSAGSCSSTEPTGAAGCR